MNEREWQEMFESDWNAHAEEIEESDAYGRIAGEEY